MSCVNIEVVKFNRQVKKIMELQPKVKILELTLDRCHFTTHGLHLNSKGKTVVSQNLALVVQQCFNKVNRPPTAIALTSKDYPLNNNTTMELQDTNTSNTTEEADNPASSIQGHPLNNNNNTTIELQDTNTTEEADNPTSSIHHRRNCLVRRNPDFLWM
jgi:hypothetical protein